MTEKPLGPEMSEKAAEKSPAKTPVKASAKKRREGKKRSRKPAAKGGRPEWRPSIDERTAVEQMKFCGESEATIARSLKVDVATLRKHCDVELADGYANRRRQVTEMLFKAAKDGNVSAIKRLDEMGKVSGAAQALRDRAISQGPAKEPKPEKPGKKEQRKIAAQQIDGKFAPPAPPKLVVSNP